MMESVVRIEFSEQQKVRYGMWLVYGRGKDKGLKKIILKLCKSQKGPSTLWNKRLFKRIGVKDENHIAWLHACVTPEFDKGEIASEYSFLLNKDGSVTVHRTVTTTYC